MYGYMQRNTGDACLSPRNPSAWVSRVRVVCMRAACIACVEGVCCIVVYIVLYCALYYALCCALCCVVGAHSPLLSSFSSFIFIFPPHFHSLLINDLISQF